MNQWKSMNKTVKKYTENFKIEISKISVGKRYYSFNYILFRNGVLIKKDEYASTHSRSPQTMRKYLRNGYAAELVLERL